MSFTESLSDILGGQKETRGVAIVGMDGIVVEEKKRDDSLDLHTLGAECSGLFRAAEKGSVSMDGGAVVEMVITSERFLLLLRKVTDEYFLALVLHPDGNIGKGRYQLRRASPQLKSEL